MTQDYEKDAVEALGTALFKSRWQCPWSIENGPTEKEEVAAEEELAWAKKDAEIALAADPLRRLLGPEAVRALLEGRAAVIEIDGRDCALLGEEGANRNWIEIRCGLVHRLFNRLDKPSKEGA